MRSSSPLHFFGSRFGINLSTPATQWRYGTGNVYSPAPEHSETENATANAEFYQAQHFHQARHPGVILQSQYGNGIITVDADFLADANHHKEGVGRIVVKGDGLFTTLEQIPLLNKSGDAHAILFSAANAVGIIVGSWRCLQNNIFQAMLAKFAEQQIDRDKITVSIGPGLGKQSYGIGSADFATLHSVFGADLAAVTTSKINKHGQTVYYLDVPALLQCLAREFGFRMDVSECADTFDKTAWKQIKQQAITTRDPELPLRYYQSCKFFSARLYTRVDRLSRNIADTHKLPLPAGLAILPESVDYKNIKQAGVNGRYDETGRCLNAIMRR